MESDTASGGGAMSAGSSANNSWTIVTPEETAAETLRPLAEGTEHHGGSLTSAAVCGQKPPAEGLPVERHLVSNEEKFSAASGDTSTEQHGAAAVTAASVPTSGGEALGQSGGPLDTTASTGPDTDSFSDSCAHTAPSPSPGEPPEFTQEEEGLAEEGRRHQLDGEGSDLSPEAADLWKPAEEGDEPEPELRRRRSLLEQIGRSEEEEEVEEEFRPPQREDNDDSGFSVNKCILGVVILLGLGTLFVSGVFMNLDEESEYGSTERKDAEEPRKPEWLNPEVPPLPLDAAHPEILNKLAKGSQQISLLQAQLQEQKEELKVAKLQAEEGVKARLQWEEMEMENSRLKKENERMKKELESVPALQKELESLRSTVKELNLASAASEAAVKSVTSPPSGRPGNGTQASAGSKEGQPKKSGDDQSGKRKDVKKDQMGQKKESREGDAFEWKEGKKRERKDEGKTEWQQGNVQGKFDKEKDKGGKQKRHGDETKQWKNKERKEKTGREDEGKSWKYKKEWIEKDERKEKEAKDWKKTDHENKKEGKSWRGKEEKKDWKVGKDHAGKHEGKEEWKGEKERNKGKDVFEASLKKDWKEKEWKKKDGDWKSKDGGKEGKGKDDRKSHGKERHNEKRWNEHDQKTKNGKDARVEKTEESWKGGRGRGGRGDGDEKPAGERKRGGSSSRGPKEEHRWGGGELPHTHSRPSPGQPEYWLQQRLRLRRKPPPPQCGSAETCAQAEGLLPVPFPEFRALLQTYLAKAEEAGADGYEREELDKLAAEFFRDGVFAHDQTSFREFSEDLGDILEDLVDDDDDDDDDDSEAEEEMEEFEGEVMERFSVAENVGGSKGEWRRQSGPGRG